MRAGHQMSNAYMLKEGAKLVILTPLPRPVSLEVLKFLKNFRFVLKQVNPREFAKIINKWNIVIISSNRRGARAPNIRENQF
jgi:hypothetical protein